MEEIGTNAVGSIGSGNKIEAYVDHITALNKDFYNPIMQAEVGIPGGFGQVLAFVLAQNVRDNSAKGISPYFHIAQVKRGSIMVGNNNHESIMQSGERIQLEMPPVATSWNQFIRVMKTKGVNIAAVSALA